MSVSEQVNGWLLLLLTCPESCLLLLAFELTFVISYISLSCRSKAGLILWWWLWMVAIKHRSPHFVFFEKIEKNEYIFFFFIFFDFDSFMLGTYRFIWKDWKAQPKLKLGLALVSNRAPTTATTGPMVPWLNNPTESFSDIMNQGGSQHFFLFWKFWIIWTLLFFFFVFFLNK